MPDASPRSTAKPPLAPCWTEEQLRVIQARDANLVVSASAGSGKTAVLTERVFCLLTGEHSDGPREPIPLGRLLVITFTEKAAAEMRERIESRLKAALLVDPPGHEPVIEAINALPAAWIMTIDAFCRRVVVEHFHRAGIAPGARVPEARELAQLEREALDRLLEERLANAQESKNTREALRAHERGVEGLQVDVRRLARFLESLDNQATWLTRERGRVAQTLAARSLADLPDAAAVTRAFRRATTDLIAMHRQRLAWAKALPDGDAEKAEKLAAWRAQLDRLAEWADAPTFSPDAMRDAIDAEVAPILGKLNLLKTCGKQLFKADDGEFRASCLAPAAKAFERWRERWLALDDAGGVRGERLAAERAKALMDLAEALMVHLTDLKRRRGLVSFNDYERLALKVLSAKDDPKEPSDVAQGYRELFAETLVDEYQDTSPLQDAIIRRVSRWNDPVPGHASSLFVVGDYKQSIYRFRYADPSLFLGLLASSRSAQSSQNGPAAQVGVFRSLPMRRNFRSRPGIIAFVNATFERLMDEAVGEVAYAAGEALVADRVDPPGTDPVCVEARWLSPPARQETRQAEEDESDASDLDDEANVATSGPDGEPNGKAASTPEEADLAENVEAQATWIARRIRELTDPATGLRPATVDADGQPAPSPIRPGDCAILVRSVRSELAAWVRALEREGIATRVQGIDPLLESQALQDLLAALRLADNPLQDYPLATVLRSPMVGLTEDELLAIRLAGGGGTYHEVLWRAAGRPLPGAAEPASDVAQKTRQCLSPELSAKVQAFLGALDGWRRLAAERSAEEVLDAILKTTEYGSWLAGQPEAVELLRGLDYLRERLRSLGTATEGRNPLATFLEQVDEALEAQEAVGEAPEPVAEPDSAVRLLTVHSAKGLQFPVVFLPRLERAFHRSRQDAMVTDHEGGLGLRGVDADRRRYCPTLRQQAMCESKERQERSEELRLLYVALTRARERLILVGRPRSRAALDRLGRGQEQSLCSAKTKDAPPVALDRLMADSPLSLLAPIIGALATRPDPPAWLDVAEIEGVTRPAEAPRRPALARALARVARSSGGGDGGSTGDFENVSGDDWAAAVAALQEEAGGAPIQPMAMALLPELDPTRALCALPGKTTVTALRRVLTPSKGGIADPDEDPAGEADAFAEEESRPPTYARRERLSATRPSWLETGWRSRRLDGAQRGTLMHQALARVPLAPAPTAESLRMTALEAIRMAGLVKADRAPGLAPTGEAAAREAISGEADAMLNQLDLDAMAWFFETEPGRWMLAHPSQSFRELPFTTRKPAYDFSVEAGRAFPDESVLVQGIIDVVLDEGDQATVLDFKTDRAIGGRTGAAAKAGAESPEALVERYRLQVELYARAIEGIWRLKTTRAGLVFLDARRIVWIR
jgi:ATP-dependent helicase/nuclease subunit A